jgi:hypothetical protein
MRASVLGRGFVSGTELLGEARPYQRRTIMTRRTISAAVALASFLVVGAAEAQDRPFGTAGQAILSADRLFGVHAWSVKSEQNAMGAAPASTNTLSGTDIDLLWGTGSGVTAAGSANIYQIPRLAFDYVFGPGITVGGALGYLHRSGSLSTTMNNTTVSRDQPSANGFLVSPRGGYALELTPLLAIWLRAGISYFSLSDESTNNAGTTTTKHNLHGFSLGLDPQLVITPVAHAGFMVGPIADIPLSGNFNTQQTGMMNTSVDNTVKVANYGVSAGVLVYF